MAKAIATQYSEYIINLKTKNGKIGCGWEKTNVFIENF